MTANVLFDWFTTAAGNDTAGALFPEGQTRASLNNGARQVQASLRTFANDPGWIEYGDGNGPATIAFVSASAFSVAGANVTANYHAGRRVKASGSSTGTIYGTIFSSTFSTDTTVNVDWDNAGVLINEALTIWIGAAPDDANGAVQTPQHAMGRPNLLSNGEFVAWSLGQTLVSTTDAQEIADNAYLLSDGADIADISKETTTRPTGAPAALLSDVQTANKKYGFLFPLSAADSAMLVNGTASLTFKVRKGSGNATLDSIRAAIITWSGTADAYTLDVVSAWNAVNANPTLVANWTYENTPFTITLTNSYRTFRITNVAVDTASGANVAVFIWVNDTDATVSDRFFLADVKIEPGAFATPIARRTISQHGLQATGTILVYANVTASGTTITFSDIPNNARHIIISFFEVSTNATLIYDMRVAGESGVFLSTGYFGYAGAITAGAIVTSLTEWPLQQSVSAAANTYTGQIHLVRQKGGPDPRWSMSGSLNGNHQSNGSVLMTGESNLKQVRIIGNGTFDNGQIGCLVHLDPLAVS